MTSLSPRLFVDLIGKPFRADARGPAALDCVGLACEVLRRCGHVVPDFVSSEAELHRQMAAGGILAGASPLPRAEAGCVVLLRSLGRDRFHVGIMIDQTCMLHASEVVGAVVIERLRNSAWAYRIVGFYLLDEGGAA